jgi:hypothetical protein
VVTSSTVTEFESLSVAITGGTLFEPGQGTSEAGVILKRRIAGRLATGGRPNVNRPQSGRQPICRPSTTKDNANGPWWLCGQKNAGQGIHFFSLGPQEGHLPREEENRNVVRSSAVSHGAAGSLRSIDNSQMDA